MPSDFWKGKRVFITGANGFIGSWLSKALVKQNAIVFSGGLKKTSSAFCEQILVDVLDKASLQNALKKARPEVVFHLALKSIVGENALSDFFSTNVLGTANLLEECRKLNVSNIAIASSVRVYDGTSAKAFSEEQPILGLEAYDSSMACSDMLARSFAKKQGLKLNVLRSSNTFGGGDLHFSRIVPMIVKSALKNEKIILYGSGSLKRDFLYVEDSVNAYLALAEKAVEKNIQGEAFNIASGKTVSLKELAEKVVKLSKSSSGIYFTGVTNRKEKSNKIDISKARKVLEWKPEFSLDNALEKTIKWYEGNKQLL